MNVMRRVVSLKPMPWSHFTNGAFPGSSRAVFGRFLVVRTGHGETPTGCRPFFHPGPRVTFKYNLKGEKYTTYQACEQSGSDSAGPLS